MTAVRLHPTTDVSPADWMAAEIGAFGAGVASLVPNRYASYARILHPAWTRDEELVRWSEVAAWSGRTLHGRAQFEALARPAEGAGRGAAPWDEEPRAGELPPALLSVLCERLARHTRTPERCWLCLWDGYGWIPGSPASVTIIARKGGPPAAADGVAAVPPAFPPEVLEGPRVRLPAREYILFEGPLDAAAEMGHRLDDRTFFPQSPNLFWPDDRAWCVATEIDLDSTYVGGAPALVRDLLDDPRLEVLPADPADPVTAASDDVNR